MLYLFKQAAHLQGKDYLRGLREVPSAVERDPYFHKLVAGGLVVEPDAAKVVSVETPQQRQDKLLKRLLGDKAPKAPASPAVKEPEAPKPALTEEEELAQLEEDEKSDKELAAAKAKGLEASKKKHGKK